LDGATITTQRPPFQPETIAHLAGRSFQPRRLTPMHQRHIAAGAQMMPAGLWLRPAYYGSPDNRDQAIAAEAKAVRENVGMIDVSTLGGLEIRGPDATEFLSRIYTFAYKKQPVDRSRYILVTDANGTITDDGVACRVSEQHFYVTATTGGVDALYQAMLRYRAEWALEVDIANVTTAYAAVNVAGPASRAVLEKVTTGVDLSMEAFPHLEARLGQVAGIPARLIRVGFVGELGYELHVPSSQGEALWDALVTAGAEYDMRLFGVEAQRLLRLEKGHLIVSQDTDGLTFPQEVNMEWAIAGKKPFFVGKRAIAARAAQGLTRKQVGFSLPLSSPLPEECNLTLHHGEIAGRVTSAARSQACNSIVGLAFVAPEQAEPDQRFDIRLSSGELVQATVVPTPFYDPKSKRQEM
jgi:sarcosine oxidase subunit alpha